MRDTDLDALRARCVQLRPLGRRRPGADLPLEPWPSESLSQCAASRGRARPSSSTTHPSHPDPHGGHQGPSRLTAIPIFAGLGDDQQRLLATLVREVSVPAGAELVKQGDYAYDVSAIDDGEVEVLRDDERVAMLGPGDFFGEIGVLERTLRTATVVATTPMRLITLTHWDLKRAPGVIDEIRATLEERKHALAAI